MWKSSHRNEVGLKQCWEFRKGLGGGKQDGCVQGKEIRDKTEEDVGVEEMATQIRSRDKRSGDI